MDFYNSIKSLLLVGTVVIAGGRALMHYGKNESKDMWVSIFIGALVYFFVNGPQDSLQALVVFECFVKLGQGYWWLRCLIIDEFISIQLSLVKLVRVCVCQ